MECSINNQALSLLMKHLIIDQRQKAPNFSAFHWSPHGSLVSIGQYFVTTRVVHLPKRTETSLITKLDQSRPNHQLSQLCTACTAWSESDQAVRAVHSCDSWFHNHISDKTTSLLNPETRHDSFEVQQHGSYTSYFIFGVSSSLDTANNTSLTS